MVLRTPAIVLVAAAFALAACDAVRPLAKSPEDQGNRLEVAVFEGGYGIEWHRRIARHYERLPDAKGVQIDLWGDPRLEDKLKPRLLRGDPPDLYIAHKMPSWLLIADGKVRAFNEALDQPAYGSSESWRSLFVPGTLDMYASEGKVYSIPTAFAAWGCWYDAKMFREHGWTPPKTWGEFTALCDRIDQAGIAPLAFQGKYPTYAWYTFASLIQRCGGLAAINRLNVLEPGAFSQPDVVRAAQLLQDVARKYFQKGALAMTHTESQLQFVNGQAAMIWCGIWLENEMKKSTPPAFEMRCFSIPAVEGGKGNPALFLGEGQEWAFVPVEAKHPERALDFCRYMVSLENGPSMGRDIGVISPLKGGAPKEAVSPALRSVIDMIEGAPGIFTCRLPALLLTWNEQAVGPGLGALLRGEIAPEEFCQRLDRGIEEAKRNPDVLIPPCVPYDPARFGENP